MKFNRQFGGKWLVLPLVLIACQTHAGTADVQAKTPTVATYGQLDQLRSQNALLAEELKNAELKSKLKSGASAIPGAAPGMAPTPYQLSQAPAPAPAKSLPAPVTVSADVQMVSTGRDGRLVALLALDTGRQLKVWVGSTIPGVGTIKSISGDEVVMLTTKGKAISLPFGSEPVNMPTSSSGPTPMLGMPSLSTVMPPLPRGSR